MAREDLFSKLNIKDYNNQLENVLENKSFTEDTKNILLSVLYKVETAYEDYSKVKVYTDSKKDLLENILPFWLDRCEDKVNGGYFNCIFFVLFNRINNNQSFFSIIIQAAHISICTAYSICKKPVFAEG